MIKLKAGLVGTIALAAMTVLLFMLKTDNSVKNSVLPTGIQQRSSKPPALNLAPGLIPPTNRWFSSLVFSPKPEPVYAYPLAYQANANGFGLAYPKVFSEPDLIKAPFVSEISVSFSVPLAQIVSNYDDLSVTLELSSSGKSIASTRLIQGSPFTFTRVAKASQLTLSAINSKISQQTNSSYTVATADNIYLISFPEHSFSASTDSVGLKISALQDQALLSVAILPDISLLPIFQSVALNEITATSVAYNATDDAVDTEFKLDTTASKPTLLGLFAFQANAQITPSPAIGSYTTLYGKQTLYSGTSFSYRLRSAPPRNQLDLGNITATQRIKLSELVTAEASTLKFTKTDSYFASKALYRAAMLLQLAHQLGLTDVEQSLRSSLKAELSIWLNPKASSSHRYFYYDKTIKGLVGVDTSFGSELFNDHHFHYGYMIAAAAILGHLDQDFVDEYRPMVDLIVKDIANNNPQDKNFPYLRVFDRYTGHSFASGYSVFTDGNNQESSSEAVNAWAGAYDWASVTGDVQAKATARYLYANESSSALAYWLNIDRSQSIYQNYRHNWVGIVWGAKLDYATFFDASPESKLAIQLLPLSPAQDYAGANRDRVAANLAALTAELGGKGPLKFADYLLMYQALSDPKAALAALPTVDATKIDDGNSMSYLYAWVYSHQAKP